MVLGISFCAVFPMLCPAVLVAVTEINGANADKVKEVIDPLSNSAWHSQKGWSSHDDLCRGED